MGFRLWIMGGELPPFVEQDNPASFSSSFLTRFVTTVLSDICINHDPGKNFLTQTTYQEESMS